MAGEYGIDEIRAAARKACRLAAERDGRDAERESRLFVARCVKAAAGNKKIPGELIDELAWEYLGQPYDDVLRYQLVYA